MTLKGPVARRFNLTVSVTVGALVTGVLAALVILQLNREVWDQQSADARLLLDQVNDVRREGFEVLDRLNRLNAEGCSDDLMNQMRKELFFANHLRDIGYVRGQQLLCSSSRGLLSVPLELPEPDFISRYGVKVWGQAEVELLGRRIVTPMAARGNIHIVYDDSLVYSMISHAFRWQLVYRDDRVIRPFMGHDNTFRPAATWPHSSASVTTHYQASCHESHPYCVAQEASNLALAARHSGLLILLSATCLIAGIASTMITNQFLRWHSSARNRLRRGLRGNHVYPLFQPIVDLASGRVIGCEALARFQDRHGPLYPDTFIPLIAEMGLSWPLTRRIIRQAVSQLEANPAIPDHFLVNINLFPDDIVSGRVRDLAGVEAWMKTRLQLNFEITEDQQLDNATAHGNLQWLRDQGFGLAVDDFGTGYSNLSYIRDLQCDALKIDRSFITDIEEGGVRASIVPIMVHLAAELQLKVVAEGIENTAQRDIVREMGIACGQGWLYGKPMSADELAQLVTATGVAKPARAVTEPGATPG